MIGKAALLGILKKSFAKFWNNDCMSMAGAIAYSTVLSLPALLILILTVAGLFLSPKAVQEALQTQLGGMIGAAGKEQIGIILSNAKRPDISLGAASGLGILVLVVGATGAFIQLQTALNKAWEVKPDPKQGGIRGFLLKRVLSFGLILGLAFLLLVSLVLSAALSALGGQLGRLLPGFGGWALELLNNTLSFVAITALIAAMFKFLPDADIAWRDVVVGAVVTTFLFILGKFAIGFYLGQSDLGAAFGAAASLAVLLVWIYYASLIVLFGAEFTQSWSRRLGGPDAPEEGAVRVVEVEREIRDTPATRNAKG
jgi:membrane protein